MLIYHFGTRDGLLREVLGQARRRQVEAFTDLIRLRPDEPYPTTLARAWSAISGPQGEPYLRMFGRLHDTAGEPLWPGFRRTATTDWLAPLEEGMRSLGRPELATVVLAVIRGLLMDLDATGDTARTDRAFHDRADCEPGPAEGEAGEHVGQPVNLESTRLTATATAMPTAVPASACQAGGPHQRLATSANAAGETALVPRRAAGERRPERRRHGLELGTGAIRRAP